MDSYYGSSIDDVVVPNQELSYRLPSPENWPRWGIRESECFEFPNKSFLMDAKLSQDELYFNGEILSNEFEMESPTHDKDHLSSSIDGESSGESLQQSAFSHDYQLDCLAGLEQMDDLFLNSLIGDPPGTENLHVSFCSEHALQNYGAQGDNVFTDMILDAESISDEVYSIGSCKFLKTRAFSSSGDQENDKISASPVNPCNSEKKHCSLVKALPVKVLPPSENYSMKEHVDEETSLEESVLQELELVMAQLTNNTRICFRDALYRLAKNSRQHMVTQNQNGNISMGTTWTGEEERLRPKGSKSMELETNTIDRAVANLMFNKMHLNVHDCSASASVSSRQKILKSNRPPDYSSSPQQLHSLPRYPLFSSDVEVPIFCPGHLQLMTIHD